MIDSPLQPMGLATDRDPHLVQTPEITRPGLRALQRAGIGHTKFQALSSDRLIRDPDPPLVQHLFHKMKARWEAEVWPHRMRYQLTQKTVLFVAHR
ncbi:hypothetical protein GCM10007207_18200 [Asaia siamensis]|uniref:Uncharacterized protein n=1 Tax=Asaia siamensis TaxID=110479 RepID=A0ABQ1M171_9PROT|nr:hypothetical protein GCM10007207_18200 [Asaia siamensis]